MSDLSRISSSSNAVFKQVKGLLSQRKCRDRDQAFVVETLKFVHAGLDAGRVPELLIFPERFESGVASFESVECPIYVFDDGLYDEISPTGVRDGVMAVFSSPEMSFESFFSGLDLSGSCRLLLLDQVQNPLNLGAIIRSAVGFGIDGVLLTKGCVDVGHPDAIRAMAGYWFGVPIAWCEEASLARLKDGSFEVVGLCSHSEQSLETCSFSEHCVMVFGSEGQGISSDWVDEMLDTRVGISLHNGVDSLNVGVSAGVVCFALGRSL